MQRFHPYHGSVIALWLRTTFSLWRAHDNHGKIEPVMLVERSWQYHPQFMIAVRVENHTRFLFVKGNRTMHGSARWPPSFRNHVYNTVFRFSSKDTWHLIEWPPRVIILAYRRTWIATRARSRSSVAYLQLTYYDYDALALHDWLSKRPPRFKTWSTRCLYKSSTQRQLWDVSASVKMRCDLDDKRNILNNCIRTRLTSVYTM